MTRRPIVLGNDAEKKARELSYNKRLKAIMTALTLGGLLITSLYFYNIWRTENHRIESRLETFTELRQATLSRFVNSLAQETELWASHESVGAEAQRYIDIWERLSANERASLRAQFIDGKANMKASDMYGAYLSQHDSANANRAAFMHHHSYYDVFYFNLEGDLVYTVEKEADYGLNFSANGGGKYAQTGLAQVFRNALKSDGNAAMFYDFAPYAPSNGAPAAFIASPIKTLDGKTIGVYAIQISIEKFDAVLRYASGLGETGETYVVGTDGLMRNNSRLSDTPTLLVKTVDNPAVTAALAGKSTLTTGVNSAGHKTMIAAQPLEFSDVNWAVVTEMEMAELRAPLKPYMWFYLMAFTFITGFGFVQYRLLKHKT